MGSYAHETDSTRTRDVLIDENVNFASMLLPELALKGLNKEGFKRPSPIQLAAIPLGRCGFDLVVQAKSGTGKTLVFALLALETVDLAIKRTQVVIIAPTREIAVQIADVIETVGRFYKGLKVGVLIGGMKLESSQAKLRQYHVVVGAPGRIRHLIETSVFDATAVRLLVLDEADKLMEPVFVKDINCIYNSVAESKQVIACSATYPSDLVDFVKQYMRRGMHITPSGGPCPILLGLRQFVNFTADHCNRYTRQMRKQEALFRLISTVQFDQCLVFSNYVVRAETLSGVLKKQGWNVSCLTSNQDQSARLEAINDLKTHKARILVTTDLSARGIDAPAVNLVINMEVPHSPETYLHRIGRAGRFGNKGLCVTIVSRGEDKRNFELLIGRIGEGDMAVSVVPSKQQADLWNDEGFETVTGIREEKEVAPLAESSLEEGEIVDTSTEETTPEDTAESVVSESPPPAPSVVQVREPSEEQFVPQPRRTWKHKYDYGDTRDVDRLSGHFRDMKVSESHCSSSPWREGHEHLWRNGRPQNFPIHCVRPYTNGFQDSPNHRYRPQEGLYNDPPHYRYNPDFFPRYNQWMSRVSTQIDNYIQYSRRFHT